jgi:post-segregation antitoxin (ccd killing protein)
MGNMVHRPRRVAGVSTSVRLDIDVYLAAQKKGINISEVTNAALRGLLKAEDEDMTEEQVAALVQERSAKIEARVEAAAQDTANDIEAAYIKLQPAWNQYLAAGGPEGRPLVAKLSWIDGRKGRLPALSGMENQAILAALEGTG